jgi:hypothetical protein
MSKLCEKIPGRNHNEVARISGTLMALLINIPSPSSIELLTELVNWRLQKHEITKVHASELELFLADLIDRTYASQVYVPDDRVEGYYGTAQLAEYIRSYAESELPEISED